MSSTHPTWLVTAALAATLALASPAGAQAQLTRSGGVLGTSVTYDMQAGPFEIFALLPSLSAGPTPLAFVDPADPRILCVGLDLMAVWTIGFLDPTGQAGVTFPLPAAAGLQGLPLRAQFVTVPGVTTLVDEISNKTAFVLGFPDTTEFTLGDVPESLDSHGLAVLEDGTVLLSGGLGLDALGNTLAQDGFILFDPQTQEFSPTTGQMQHPRSTHNATRLLDGRVLLSGGANENDAVVGTCDIWDPATGVSTPAASMNRARALHTATLMSDGRVFVAGGGGAFDPADPLSALNNIEATTEVYDPNTNTWTLGPNLPMSRVAHRATRLNDGRILITGGVEVAFVFGVPIPTISNDCRLYDPVTGTIGNASNFAGGRGLHGQTLLDNGNVFVAGGATGDVLALSATPLSSCRIYNPVNDTWTNVASLNVARGFGDLINLGSEVLYVGGLTSVDITTLSGAGAQDIESADPQGLSWSIVGSLIKDRPLAISAPIDGGDRILVTGSGDIGVVPADQTSEIFIP